MRELARQICQQHLPLMFDPEYLAVDFS